MAGLTTEALKELVNHVFLPPKLPQTEDSGSFKHLLDKCHAALEALSQKLPAISTTFDDAARLVAASRAVHDHKNHKISELQLRIALKERKPIFLHVRAQNAGVMITYDRVGNATIEQFELAALNKAVMTTKGRLVRTFPGSAVLISWDTVREEGFQNTFAHTLSAMSHQTAPHMQPKARKAGQDHDEFRNTTHPGLVSELFVGGFLKAAGKPVRVTSVTKHTRDDVIWHTTKIPWRRSPAWTLIKVALHLKLSRAVGGSAELYKHFMAYLMARIMTGATKVSLPADLLYVMNAKVARRLVKLKHPRDTAVDFGALTLSVRQSIKNASSVIEKQWADIQKRQPRSIGLSTSLPKLDFERDCLHDLPHLDQYIQTLRSGAASRTHDAFNPEPKLDQLYLDSLPCLTPALDEEYAPANLQQFEEWVVCNIEQWVRVNGDQDNACARLYQLLEDYHIQARKVYAGNPEGNSLMLLTLLEIWISCDQIATNTCGLLLKYDHGIPKDLFQNLLLPFKAQMQRLSAVEAYLEERTAKSSLPSAKLFSLSTSDAFAVQYLDQSALHKNVFHKIQAKARKDKEAKIVELNGLKKEHARLTDLYSNTNCDSVDVVVEVRNGVTETEPQHPPECKRCEYESSAQKLHIFMFEEPLPTEIVKAKAVVFELQVPSWYSYWRDARTFLLRNVLQGRYATSSAPDYRVALPKDPHLAAAHYKTANDRQRLGLSSETKHSVTAHYGVIQVNQSLTENKVCTKSAVDYRYYDSSDAVFAGEFQYDQQTQVEVMYKLPESLSRFIFRPATAPDGPQPNLVIASQDKCPENMDLGEYKELCELPLGHNIQWHNILLRLVSPSVDFKKPETTLVFLQCIFQTGPRSKSSLRATHAILNNDEFAVELLKALKQAMQRVKENWKSSQALCLFIAIAARLLSLNESPDIQSACLTFLQDARDAAWKWVRILREYASEAIDPDEIASFAALAVETALICATTFDADSVHLNTILKVSRNASTLVQLSIAVREGHRKAQEDSHHEHSPEVMLRLLRLRFRRLLHRAYKMSADNTHGIELAIEEHLATFKRGTPWKIASPATDYWQVTETSPAAGTHSAIIHFNFLTGELLINGEPPNRPPEQYEKASSYEALFGRAAVPVVPSVVPGMRFSTKRSEGESNVHLNMNSSGDLQVRTTSSKKTFDTIPSRLLTGRVPPFFERNYIHFYDSTGVSRDKVVEFRPVEKPWSSSSPGMWRLTKRSGCSKWQLGRIEDGHRLINIESETSRTISKILSPLARPANIHITLLKSTAAIEVDIPALRLGFILDDESDKLWSRQYREMHVDDDQSLNTLIGFDNKLILRSSSASQNARRIVLIPESAVTFSQDAANPPHTNVTIKNKDDIVRVHVFGIDTQLGRLTGSDSLESKLFLGLLHALTTFCLPDPLTRQTGTEQALSELNSATVRSFDRLTQDNIALLKQIASLAPVRNYYPEHLQVMQKVIWRSNLGFLAQHAEFYFTVSSILKQAERSEIFHPSSKLKTKLDRTDDTSLLQRDLIRSSSFRVSGSGAEDHTTINDIVYKARDRDTTSVRSKNAYLASSCIFNDIKERQWSMEGLDHLWNLMRAAPNQWLGRTVSGPNDAMSVFKKVRFDVDLFSTWRKIVLEHWPGIHEAINKRQDILNPKFNFMIWLSTIGFADDVDLQVVQTLASLFTCASVHGIPIPSIETYLPARGKTHDMPELRKALEPHVKTYRETIVRKSTEMKRAWEMRQEAARTDHRDKARRAVVRFAGALRAQNICPKPSWPRVGELPAIANFLDARQAGAAVRILFNTWYENSELHRYLNEVEKAARECGLSEQVVPTAALIMPPNRVSHLGGFVSIDQMFANTDPPNLRANAEPICPQPAKNTQQSASCDFQLLDVLTKKLEKSAGHSEYIQSYVKDLAGSVLSLRSRTKEQFGCSGLDQQYLLSHRDHYQGRVQEIFDAMASAVASGYGYEDPLLANQFPRRSPMLFISQLSRSRWSKLSPPWKVAIVEYGLALTMLQRADRMLQAFSKGGAHSVDLINELQNLGHKNWDPLEYPESLLIEVEGGIMIRDAQESIASEMRSPPHGQNAVCQLNMGEGKSSLIIPIVACALANGSQLVRIVVAKPQSKQMADMLKSKLGAAVGRRVYYMPFSRSLKLDRVAAGTVAEICQECMREGGVLLVQPEHILSFKLMAPESYIAGKEEVGQSLQQTQDFFENNSRDIVDESDENFSVKFELIYTMGTQRPIENSPVRWTMIQQILQIVRIESHTVSETFGSSSIEIHACAPGAFPRIRILRPDAERSLLQQIATNICKDGLVGFPLEQQTEEAKKDVYTYMTKPELTAAEIDAVENAGPTGFWSNSTRSSILLLRGLLGGGVLAFALGQKRWRVNFGLADHKPATKLAVPFLAKDSPTPRSEFSHPDVVILLTSLCYYYGGLEDADLFTALGHLEASGQASDEYPAWVADANKLNPSFSQFEGVNLKDKQQCVSQLFPSIKYGKNVIDYFLSRIVFPKEMKEFPSKLSASGWDIGKRHRHPTTGFSGTNDSRALLPLDVGHLDLEQQNHTNALVLQNLLRPENSVKYMLPADDSGLSDAERLLSLVMDLTRSPEVILDVGAQILELNNLQVATKWLQVRSETADPKEAVIFVNDEDELSVVDTRGRVELLQTSSFASRLGACLVFLDEAHTRGIDLKLPVNYSAAVTLGANLTKDRLVQACMRMRKLGHGQSVVFLASKEIQTRIRERTSKSNLVPIEVLDVLQWSICETFAEMHRNVPLWAVQGERFVEQEKLWNRFSHDGQTMLSKPRSDKFLAVEARSIDDRYRPRLANAGIIQRLATSQGSQMRQIAHHCQQFDDLKFNSSALQEEQERELSPEIEQERQIQRAAPASPAVNKLEEDVRKLVLEGTQTYGTSAYLHAFDSLLSTSGAKNFDVKLLRDRLLVTADFARTVLKSANDGSDQYQRSVQWIVSRLNPYSETVDMLLVVSPYEANLLLPQMAESKTTTMHLYKARCNSGYPALDRLELFTSAGQQSLRTIPRKLVAQLNLFAGQLYFSSYEDYQETCKLLHLTTHAMPKGWQITPNGFILSDGETTRDSRENPVQFIKTLMTAIRRNGQGIEKTHMGRLLEGNLLQKSEFEEGEKYHDAPEFPAWHSSVNLAVKT